MGASPSVVWQASPTGVEVIFDDRSERFGFKMADAELIGYPKVIVVGRKAGQGLVEMVDRKSGERVELSIESF